MTRTGSKEAAQAARDGDSRQSEARSRHSNGGISPGRSNDQQSRTVIRTATPGGRIGHLRSLGAGHVDHHAARHAVLVSVVAVVLEPPAQHPDGSPSPLPRHFHPCPHRSIVRSGRSAAAPGPGACLPPDLLHVAAGPVRLVTVAGGVSPPRPRLLPSAPRRAHWSMAMRAIAPRGIWRRHGRPLPCLLTGRPRGGGRDPGGAATG